MRTSGNNSFVLALLMAAVVMMIFTAIADAFFSHYCPSLCRKLKNHIFGNCMLYCVIFDKSFITSQKLQLSYIKIIL